MGVVHTGLLTTRYKADAVLLAALQTGAAVTGLSLFAFRKDSKYDLTAFGSSLFAGLLILLMSGVLAFFFKIRIPEVVMGGLGALLFSAFLVYDTQRIVGRGETQLDDRDYVLGAMDLYLVGKRGGNGWRDGRREETSTCLDGHEILNVAPASLSLHIFAHRLCTTHRTSPASSFISFVFLRTRMGANDRCQQPFHTTKYMLLR